MSFLPLNEPIVGEPEKQRLLEAIDSGYVSSAGPAVTAFEEAIASRLGVEHAVATASGTAALHLALLGVGVGAGDLVAVSDLTFIASANAALYCGADLLLVGPDPATWSMDTELLYENIRARARSGERLPAAVEVVHILGHPARWEPLERIRSEFGIPIVEDSAEALGAKTLVGEEWYECGTLGEVGCLSFNGNKLITTGGGGMLVTNNGPLADRARHLSTQARLPGAAYRHDAVGYNYRMPALSAALGTAQLDRLNGFIEDKLRIRQAYAELFSGTAVTLAPVADWARPTHWLVSARLGITEEERDRVVLLCNNQGIGIRPIWRPLHLQDPCLHSERLGTRASVEHYTDGISLPSTPSLTPDDIHRVTETVVEAIAEVAPGREES